MTGKPSDITMQNVPLTAVTVDNSKDRVEDEMLPTGSDGSDVLESKNSKPEDIQVLPEIHHKQPNIFRLICEAILVPLFMIIPALIVRITFSYDLYSFSLQKGPGGLNELREFERWSYFFAVSYLIIVLAQLIFRLTPKVVLTLCRFVKKNLTHHELTAIACLGYASGYLGLIVAMIVVLNWAEFILYTPSQDLAAQQVFSKLNLRERADAMDFLLGGAFESALVALVVFAFVMGIEKYIVAMFREAFHRIALAPRIKACNSKFLIISRLYRAATSTGKSRKSTILSNISIHSTESFESEQTHLLDDKSIDLSSIQRARGVARTIFKSLCPVNKDRITSADFKPYFSPGEHEEAFAIFDTNRKGELDKTDFRVAVEAVYEERARTAGALVANGRMVKKLDWTLSVVFVFFGLLLALCIYNSDTFTWVSSIGTFLLGFSFLFQTTVTRVFDTFLFVFIEHAYDVGDSVIVDSEKLSVREIDIFTTIFKRNDGILVYAPNSSLKGKTIYNRQRRQTEADEIQFNCPASTPIESFTKLRGQLIDHLTETSNKFTGEVALNVIRFIGGEGGDRRARMQLVSNFRPHDEELRSDLKLHQRRADLLAKFTEFTEQLKIEVKLEDTDK